MNKKTFTLVSFLTAFGILFLGSFYAWVISQFNETKFLTKFNYYFNKNFPSYVVEVSDIKFKVSNKLSYEMSNLVVKNKISGNEILVAPYLVLDIPVGAFLGNRDIRLKAKDMKVYYENSKSFKSVFFSTQSDKETVQLDLPQLIDRNKFSLRADNFSVQFRDKTYSKNFRKVFFKNLNMTHYTAFEIDGELGDGTYRLYGEINLGNFLKSRNIKMEAYLAFKGFPEALGYLNDVTFKVLTSQSPSSYAFKLNGLTDNAKGSINFLADSQKLKVSLENFVTTEKIIKDQLLVDRYYSCSKSKNVNIDGVLTYHYEIDLWEPNYSLLGDCVQVQHTLKEKDPLLYNWDVKFIEEQGVEVNIQASDFFMSKKSLQKIQFIREYLEFNNQSSLDNFVTRLEKLYSATNELDDLNFPVFINIKKIDLDKNSYNLKASGIASNDGLTFGNIVLKSGKDLKGKGSLIYSYPENETTYNFEFRNAPVKFLESFMKGFDMNFKGTVTRGRISQQVEDKEIKKAFDIKINKGDFEWRNLLSLINSKLSDSNTKIADKLLWSSDFSSLKLLGTEIGTNLEVDWTFRPGKNKSYTRSGQLRKINGNNYYDLSIMFDQLPLKTKKYLIDKFGSDEVTFKLEKSEEFKAIQ